MRSLLPRLYLIRAVVATAATTITSKTPHALDIVVLELVLAASTTGAAVVAAGVVAVVAVLLGTE